MKLHLKHPIFDILSIPTLNISMYVVDMYVLAGFAMMEFLKMLRRSSKALFGEDK